MADEMLGKFIRPGRVSAVFAADDWMALGFMNRPVQFDVRIPEDISVIDCDDIPVANEAFTIRRRPACRS